MRLRTVRARDLIPSVMPTKVGTQTPNRNRYFEVGVDPGLRRDDDAGGGAATRTETLSAQRRPNETGQQAHHRRDDETYQQKQHGLRPEFAK